MVTCPAHMTPLTVALESGSSPGPTSPVKLPLDKVPNPHRTPPLKVALDGLQSQGNSSPRLSPNSWQDSFEELSRGLQRICHSPGRELPNSPLSSTPPTPPSTSSPTHVTAVARQADVGSVVPGKLLARKHVLVRVRHEESSEQLQRQLSRISGFNLDQGLDGHATTQPTSTSPVEARRRVSITSLRFRMQLDLQEDVMTSLSQLSITCEGGQLWVAKHDGGRGEEKVLAKADLEGNVDPDKLSCSIEDRVLHIRELPNKVRRTEARWGSSRVYCPISVEQNSTWFMSYRIPACFAPKNVSLKTVDDRLHVMFRQMNPEFFGASHKNKNSTKSSPGSKTAPHDPVSPSSLSSEGETSPTNGHGKPPKSTTTLIKVTVTLPENVMAHSVQAAILTEVNQLLVVGRTSGAGRSRCQTL